MDVFNLENSDKSAVNLLAFIVWKYGEVFIDDDGIEHHIVKVTNNDYANFYFLEPKIVLEMLNSIDDVLYYRIRMPKNDST